MPLQPLRQDKACTPEAHVLSSFSEPSISSNDLNQTKSMEEPIVMQSAVRLPTPPPPDAYPAYSSTKRKRSPLSRSPSPRSRRPPPNDSAWPARGPLNDAPYLDNAHKSQNSRRSQPSDRIVAAPKPPMTEEEKQAAAKAEYEKLSNMRSGGTYIPPARLRALQAQITDKKSKEYQRMAWEALKKSINGLINKVNVSNIKHIVPELFAENLIRGRGLFCRSIMKAQAASLPFTPIYAAMAAIVNTKLPGVGGLLLSRLIVQFKKAFKRNDKAVCLSSTTFIAHLCNQQVAHEMLAAQMLLLLLHNPTNDSVEIAVGLTREVGQYLEEMSGSIAAAVFDQFRSILHEQDIDNRVQYMIEVLFQVRRDKYRDNPAIKEELDLVEEEDQITHRIGLDDEIEVQDNLNIFKFDPDWEENEESYRKTKAQILGEEDGSDVEDGDESEESSDDEAAHEESELEIKDQSNTDLVNLRRTLYLTIQSSNDFEDCCHRLMKVNIPAGQEPQLPEMIVQYCSLERTYTKFIGSVGERFAKLNRLWTELFEQKFIEKYETIHRNSTNEIRNIAKFFGHIISSDAIGWHVLSVIHLNQEETTSSSRLFIKCLFQDFAEALGMAKLQSRLSDNVLQPSYTGIFPKDNPQNTKFAINFFVAIGMGALGEDMREHLKNTPKVIPPAPVSESESESSVSSYSSYTGSSRSDSRSRSPSRNRIRGRLYSRSRSPSRKRGGEQSRSRSVTMPRARGRNRSYSQTPPRPIPRRSVRDRSYTRSISHTPPRRNVRGRSASVSQSPSPEPRRRRYSSSPPPVRRRYSSSPASPPARYGRNRKDMGESRSPTRRRRSPSYDDEGPSRRDRDVREGTGRAGRARATDYL